MLSGVASDVVKEDHEASLKNLVISVLYIHTSLKSSDFNGIEINSYLSQLVFLKCRKLFVKNIIKHHWSYLIYTLCFIACNIIYSISISVAKSLNEKGNKSL